MKHTKGPWTVNQNEDTGMNDWGSILDSENKVVVTDVYGNNQDETEANVYLIAAAPDLLEACKEACLTLMQCEQNEFKPTIEILQTAINRTEGRE